MRYPEGIPEDDSPVTARGPLWRAAARAFPQQWMDLLRRVFGVLCLLLEKLFFLGRPLRRD